MALNTTDRAISTVACDLAQEVGDGLRTVVLSPPGTVESLKGTFVMDAEGAAEIIRHFDAHGNDVPIDFDHATLDSPAGQAPAAGWITKIWHDDRKGLLGLVRWNPKAREGIRSGEYRYLSPVLIIRRDDRRAVRLHSAALTNRPAIPRMEALAASARDADLFAMDAGDGSPMGLVRRIAGFLKITNPRSVADVLKAALDQLEELSPEADIDTDTEAAEEAAASSWRMAMADGTGKPEDVSLLGMELAKALNAAGVTVNAEDPAAVLRAAVDFITGKSSDGEVAASVRKHFKLPEGAGKDAVMVAMGGAGATRGAMEAARDVDRFLAPYLHKQVVRNGEDERYPASAQFDREDYERVVALAHSDRALCKRLLEERVRNMPPQGRMKAPSEHQTMRFSLIGDAAREWESSKTLRGLSEVTAYVCQKLRDAGHSDVLTDDEKHYVTEASVRVPTE
jgi:phage I-like protein